MTPREREMMSAMSAFYEEHIGTKFTGTKVIEHLFSDEFQMNYENGLLMLIRCKYGHTFTMRYKDVSAFWCSTGVQFYRGKDTAVSKMFIDMVSKF